jgi:hypothetical protein
MSEDAEDVDRSEWLLEPPGAGEVRLVVELGEGAELTPEMQASLEKLMDDLHGAEVAGFAMRGFKTNVGLFGGLVLQGTCEQLVCDQHSCEKHSCTKYKSNRVMF